MMKSKKMLYLSLILFIASLVLNFPFPHESPYGETVASVLNIPVQSVNGLHYVGIASLALLIASLYFLTKSVEKYHGRVVLVAIVLALFAPSMIASSFQKTFATGIYAVSYERDWSNCQFEMIGETTLRGECELPFENYSRNDVQFTIEFYEKYYFEDDVLMVSLMNNNDPYEVKLKGNERKTVKIESNIDVSNMENHIEQGSSTGVNIIIKSGEKIRKL
ncbi:hypothetical protein MHI39_01220 [Heyndrickxia sp. FSL K6-6286]|uniref:hypothetical protein n=3 Tax=Bacillales TaxID=1385 RepID=UPI0003A5AEA6|nr:MULTISPECIES: hypothetical protein [unclassified Bacillus (in: firmicutes)]RFB09702.1 hypothetical protein DZB84_23780 [Bacillus sp. HNG]CAI9392335.1 hypothetical protein BACSP_03304 [Bacillus sp. T2.9-1]